MARSIPTTGGFVPAAASGSDHLEVTVGVPDPGEPPAARLEFAGTPD